MGWTPSSSDQRAMLSFVSRGRWRDTAGERGSVILGCCIWSSLAPAVQSLSGVHWRRGEKGGVDGIRWCQSAQPLVSFQPSLDLVTSLLWNFWWGHQVLQESLWPPLCACEPDTHFLLWKAMAQGAQHVRYHPECCNHILSNSVERHGNGSPSNVVFPCLSPLPPAEEHPLEHELADDGLLAKSSLSSVL